MDADFVWDLRKAIGNRWKHGVSFEEAVTAVAGPLGKLQLGMTIAVAEQRWRLTTVPSTPANGFPIGRAGQDGSGGFRPPRDSRNHLPFTLASSSARTLDRTGHRV